MFKNALRERKTNLNALILGTGGASRAIVYALGQMGVSCQYISRKRSKTAITYDDIDETLIKNSWLIVNCTPLGTFPDVDQSPDIPFEYITLSHIAYDLIYNPSETVFLKAAKERGATTYNGLPMLEGQALASWKIWQT
jgi:shikimate dehydrogenase